MCEIPAMLMGFFEFEEILPHSAQHKFESLRVLWLSEAIQQTQNTEAICIPEVLVFL